MPLLSPQDEAYLRETFQNQMVDDVTIVLFTQRSSVLTVPGQEQQQQLFTDINSIIGELAALSPKIHLETYDHRYDSAKMQEYGVERVPSVIVGNASMRPARFIGAPAGYEFSTLIQDIIDLSTSNIALEDETREYLRNLQQPVDIKVFTTPT